MSWIEKLYKTYECCDGAPQFEAEPLTPICHVVQQAHIEIVIDSEAKFLRARVLQRGEQATTIPATEDSASRSSNEAPHALCDKIQYCAEDYGKRGGRKKAYFEGYIKQLRQWCESPFGHLKAKAVCAYLAQGSLLSDLIAANVIVANAGGKLIAKWDPATALPALFKLLLPREGLRDQGDALVRWRVERPGELLSAVWEDKGLQDSWIQFCASQDARRGPCFVTGNRDAVLADKHPRGIRFSGDGAKLISSNDNTNYTFRGRFQSAEEAYGVSFEVTQKAHIALRWLIARQGEHSKNGDQVFVSWSIGGQQIPDPMKNTAQLFCDVMAESRSEDQYVGDAGQLFALRLNKLIAGYGAKLDNSMEVVVMGLDSANPGRMAITFYRELTGSEFLQRILDWHSWHAWHQSFSKEMHFVGAPAPHDIAEAAYGSFERKIDDKLRKSTIERLLPCVVDGRSVPRDLVESVVLRSCSRVDLKPQDWKKREKWEKCLGIACGLWRGYRKEKNYQMSLEEDRTTRDYLFGRLLAIADYTEQQALRVAKEERDTNAGKLMQRFAGHPCSTWRTVELALVPYKSRLRSNRPGQLVKLEKLFDSVVGMFQGNDFTNDAKLSGEFLLGFHCQRAALWNRQDVTQEPAVESEEAVQGDES